MAERRGIDSLVLGLADQYVWTLVELGAYEEAEALAGEIVPSLEEAKDVASLVEIRELEVRVRTRRGELSQAAPMAGWVVEHARKIGQTDVLVAALTIAAALRLAIGDASGAAALLAEMEETANARDVFDYAAALPEAVRIAFGAGEPRLAGKLVHGVDSRYPLHEHALLTARALLAEHRGEHAAAEGMFADAADRWKRFELPWERAQALLGQGRCLLALNDPGAGEALRQARDILISLGARPALEEADALLERATALTS